MAKKKKQKAAPAKSDMTPVVAATLAGVIYQARLANRAAKLNISEAEVISDVVHLWRTVRDELKG
jgi:hypothetical protein